MHTAMGIQHRESQHNLHVRVGGALRGTTLDALLEVLRGQCPAQGKIFIDLRDVEPLEPQVCRVFRAQMQSLPLSPDHVYFKGEAGFKVANEGNRVLLIKKNKGKCTGRCQGCPCSRRLRDRQERMAAALACGRDSRKTYPAVG